MKTLADQLSLKVQTVLDQQDKEVEIAGSVEVKGIKGTDKRNYLVDLQGFTPRDSNYEGEEFHTCLLRPELTRMYQKTKSLEGSKKKLDDYKQKIEEMIEDPAKLKELEQELPKITD